MERYFLNPFSKITPVPSTGDPMLAMRRPTDFRTYLSRVVGPHRDLSHELIPPPSRGEGECECLGVDLAVVTVMREEAGSQGRENMAGNDRLVPTSALVKARCLQTIKNSLLSCRQKEELYAIDLRG